LKWNLSNGNEPLNLDLKAGQSITITTQLPQPCLRLVKYRTQAIFKANGTSTTNYSRSVRFRHCPL